MSKQPNIEVISNKETMAIQVGERIQKLAQDAIAERGRFTFVLTGGESPVPLYQALATDPRFKDFPWNETLCFFGDERHVPPEDSGSNFRLAKETLFFCGLIPDKNIIRMKGEIKNTTAGAEDYETELRYYFPELESPGQFPRFDLILLGLGPNGHVASLFPETEAIKENERWVVSNWIEELKAFRITMTFPVLNAARNLFLQVVDPEKKELVKKIRSSAPDDFTFPVQRLDCANYHWFLTEEVAGLDGLSSRPQHSANVTLDPFGEISQGFARTEKAEILRQAQDDLFWVWAIHESTRHFMESESQGPCFL